ncbi:Ig-like domain-containing protein, partial [bacterium]|nr:Ig-like domain-containing protein [bacterium]
LNTQQELPPRLVFLSQADNHHLSLECDRPLDEASLGEFTLEVPGTAEVVLVRLEPSNPRIVLLDIDGLQHGEIYWLTARNLRGSDGLLAEPLRREFIATESADVTPPKPVKLAPHGETSTHPAIFLLFNEAILADGAVATLTESVGEDTTEPASPLSLSVEAERNQVSLLAGEALKLGTNYDVMVSGVTDLAGNPAEDSTWLLEVRYEETGGRLEATVSMADGSPLPAEVELLLSPTLDGQLPLARANSSDGSFFLSGLAEYRAADSPYLLVSGEEEGVRFEGFYDEDGNGTTDRLGALRPGELRQVDLTLTRRSESGSTVSLAILERATATTLTVTALVTDEAGVAAVEGFLSGPGSDGTGLAFTVLPWEGLPGDKELYAYLPLSVTDWKASEERLLHVHALGEDGNWGEFFTITLTKPTESPTVSGRLLFEDTPLTEGYVALLNEAEQTVALDRSDDYGRFTLPAPVAGERLIAVHNDGSALLVGFAGGEENIQLTLHPWAKVSELSASVVRFDHASELTLPEDYLLVEVALTEPAEESFTYELGLDGEGLLLSIDMSGRITARLALPEELQERASFTTINSAGEKLGYSSENLSLQQLGFTTVTAVDGGSELRLSWSPVPGAAGYAVVLIPHDRFSEEQLTGEGVWTSRPHRLRVTELVIPEGEVEDYWGVPGGTRYVVAVCALGEDSGDHAWSFGELVHP